MHSFRFLFSSSGSFKVSRSFNRDKFSRRDAFPPSVPENRKRRQSELQIERYIIRPSHNFYENFKFSYLCTFRDEWDRDDQWSRNLENRTKIFINSIRVSSHYSYLFTELYLLPLIQGSITSKMDDDQFGSTRSKQRSVAFTNSMSHLFIRASLFASRHTHQQKSVRSKFLMASDFSLLPASFVSFRIWLPKLQ